MSELKICKKCNTEKFVNEFRLLKTGYFFSYCRPCEKQQSLMYREKARTKPRTVYKIWTNEEIEFIKLNYPDKGGVFCAKHLNLKIKVINNKAKKLGIKRKMAVEIDGFKICNKCSTKHPITDFYISHGRRTSVCRFCDLKRIQAIYFDKQKEKQEYGRQHYIRNQKGYRQRAEKWRQDNPEWSSATKQKYYHNNKKKILEQNKKNLKRRLKTDINFKLLVSIRGRINAAIKANRNSTKKSSRTLILLGCSIKEARAYIESKFQPGMSWENYGKGEDKWVLDHVVPCAVYDLSVEENQKECFGIRNLQPLWFRDNLIKNAKYNPDYQI